MPWTPDPPAAASSPRRGLRLVAAFTAVALVAGCGILGYLAWHDDRSALRWRALDRADSARAAALTTQLGVANGRIHTLDTQLGTLNGQMSSLQTQLSSVADQKEKAVDQATVLQRLLSAAGTVADDLQQCITATNNFDSAFNAAFDGQNFGQLSNLQTQAQQVNRTCNAAESANQQLQSAIQSAP